MRSIDARKRGAGVAARSLFAGFAVLTATGTIGSFGTLG
jgi:hypothetical protein